MTTTVPGALLAAGAAIANLGYTPPNPAAPTALVAAYTPAVVTTFHATAMAVNCDASNVFTTTLTANVTSAPTFTSPNDGQTVNWFFTQDATGSRTMTWPAAFKWPGGTVPTLTTAANAVDLLVATYRAATGFWYVALTKDLK